MIPSFTRASDLVPADLDATSWAALEPLYRELLGRELRCGNCLEHLILDRSELDAAVSEAGNRLYINMSCHTDDEAANRAFLAFVEGVQPRHKEMGFELDRKIVGSPHVKDLDQERYRVYLRDLKLAVELFRPENVPIETELTRLETEYSQIAGAMTVAFRGEEMTLPRMAKFNEDTDRAVREEAWRLVAERRFKDADTLDALYEKMLGLRQRVAVNAGFTNFRDYMHKAKKRFDYTPETCHEFARGVEEVCTPLLRELMAERKKALGVEKLRPWDGQVDPKGRPGLRPFATAAEMVEKTSRVFRKMDPSLAEMFEFLREGAGANGTARACLDLESRKGKAPGGYQTTLERQRKPFIFMNAAGVQRDVETILHEAGHAFHAILCRADPLVSYRGDIPLEFCEVASMSMELTAHPFLEEFYSSADSDRARRVHIEDTIASLTTIATVDQFQHWIYTHPDHTRAERHEKWKELVARYGPGLDWSGLEKFAGVAWQRIPHLYGTPFYYIEYGIAQLGALQVWINYRRDPRAAIESYKRGLSLGGSRPLPELFRAAGLEFEFGPETVRRLIDEVRGELARMPA
ncbi:MAG: M3 family oligoendopeptidase [Phycisphaerales bacterium]|nr:M3 family oligoendopeptidase [Phycisphaerales bacterium]